MGKRNGIRSRRAAEEVNTAQRSRPGSDGLVGWQHHFNRIASGVGVVRPPRRHHFNDTGRLIYDDTTDSIETRPLLPCTPTTPDYSNSFFRRYLSVSSVRRRRQMNYSKESQMPITLTSAINLRKFQSVAKHDERSHRSRSISKLYRRLCVRCNATQIPG